MKKVTLCVVLMLVGALSGFATPIIIDSFNIGAGSTFASPLLSPTTTGYFAAADAIDGSVKLTALWTAGPGFAGSVRNTFGSGRGSLALDPTVQGEAEFLYDNLGAGLNGGAGYSLAGNSIVSVTFPTVNVGTMLTITLNGVSAAPIPILAPGTYSIPLTDFGSPATLTSAMLTLDSSLPAFSDADVTIDNFMIGTPEPGTWLLAGAALIGLSYFRRRK